MYKSFAGQDIWVLDMLNNKTNGVFIDLGAGNGYDFSNTYILEKNYNWTGLCVESNYNKFIDLDNNRDSLKKNITINNFSGYCNIDEYGKITESSGITVNCNTFENIVNEFNFNKEIDYLSINIGGKELDVIKTINFNNYDIKLITIQHNIYKTNPSYRTEQFEFLFINGFERNKLNVCCLEQYAEKYGRQPYEDWYVNTKYL